VTAPSTPVLPVPAADDLVADAVLLAPVCDPLPLPVPGWGAEQARDAVAEAALVRPELGAPAALVRALSTVVFRVGECAVKVHPPGTDPAHLAAVHAVLADSPVALTATAPPVVTSSGIVTVTPWTAPGPQLGWGEVGRVLRALHDLPTAAALPAWTPLRRLPAQLEHLPATSARALHDARSSVLDRLAALVPALPLGALHGDVSPENVLSTPTGPRWIDLDFACAGLREYDLAAVVRRYAADEITDADYRAFVLGYGADLRGWPGLALLDELCALSGVGFRLWLDRRAGRPSDWLDDALPGLRPAWAAR
jgi:Phosphotransferase enzyme family